VFVSTDGYTQKEIKIDEMQRKFTFQ